MGSLLGRLTHNGPPAVLNTYAVVSSSNECSVGVSEPCLSLNANPSFGCTGFSDRLDYIECQIGWDRSLFIDRILPFYTATLKTDYPA